MAFNSRHTFDKTKRCYAEKDQETFVLDKVGSLVGVYFTFQWRACQLVALKMLPIGFMCQYYFIDYQTLKGLPSAGRAKVDHWDDTGLTEKLLSPQFAPVAPSWEGISYNISPKA